MSKTWLLFDNGNYYSVNATIHKPNPQNPRPADAYIVSENQGDFTIAAKNAVYAAYNSLSQKNKTLSANTAGIELAERTDASANIVGESGGVAFAIAYAKSLLNIETADIAATGVVMADGTIQKVVGIETKLKTAASRVSPDGFVFYPQENQFIPDSALESEFKKKQIHCHPVSHIDQVFDILMPGPLLSPYKKVWVLLLLALIVAALIGGGVYSHLSMQHQINPQEIDESGNAKPEINDLKPETETLADPEQKIKSEAQSEISTAAEIKLEAETTAAIYQETEMEPKTEAEIKSLIKPTTKPVIQPMKKPMKKPVKKPVKKHVNKLVKKPVKKPMKKLMKKPVTMPLRDVYRPRPILPGSIDYRGY